MQNPRELAVKHVLQARKREDRKWIERHGGTPKLHPSSIGHCRRQAIYTALRAFPEHPLHADITHPFDLYQQETMHSGVVWEQSDAPAFEAGGAVRHFRIENTHWTAEPDFIFGIADGNGAKIQVDTDELMVLEYKDTATKNFSIPDRLPYGWHCAQLCAYGLILEEFLGNGVTAIPLVLYYHGRGRWAQFDVWIDGPDGDYDIAWEGQVNGYWHSGTVALDVPAEMRILERYLKEQRLPPKYADPFELPFGGCVRGSKKKGYHPGCQYWGECWPDWPQSGPLPGIPDV